MATIKIHKIRGAINRERKKEGKKEISRKKFVAHVNKKYKLGIVDSSLSGIPTNLKKDIISDFVKDVEDSVYDCNEHIYLRFTHAANYSVPINLENNKDGRINIITSPSGTTDLQAFKGKMEKKMQEYADYCVKVHKAQVISYEEFLETSIELKEKVFRKPPINMSKNKYTEAELKTEEATGKMQSPPASKDVPDDFGRYD